MKASSRSQALGISAAVALLAACGGGSQLGSNPIQSNAPQTRTNLALIGRAAGTRPAPGRSWMAPNAKTKDLLYVSDFDNSDVLVFTYPGGKPVGTLTGITDAQGECTSGTSEGSWWVVASGANEILDYAHGGTSPISTLSETAGEPAGCAVDPTTGNLAATILSNGDVVIFPGAKGPGTVIATPLLEAFYDGYDDKGNLFVDGLNGSNAFALVELPKGSSSFETITLNQSIEFPGSIQWHGKYLAVGDEETSNIYQFAISGTNGTLEGTTHLEDGGSGAFYILKRNVTAVGNNGVGIWKYPAGGMPIKSITCSIQPRPLVPAFCSPIGIVVSVATK